MTDIFANQFFINNRNNLKKKLKSDLPIVLSANGLLQKVSDETYPFRQDGNFWYLTGIEEPDCILVIDGNDEFVILPELSDAHKAFYGDHDFKGLSQKSGINNILESVAGWEKLNKLIKQNKSIFTLSPPPEYIDVFNFYTNPARKVLEAKIKTVNPDIKFNDIRIEIARLRMIKQPAEIDAIQKAIDITVNSINLIKQKIKSYDYEYQIEADLTHSFRTQGAAGHAFDPIVAGGKNATIVHPMKNRDKLNKSDLVLLDVGAQYQNYAADISRTYSLSTPTNRQLEVYEAVKAAQVYAYSLIKPGVIRREYEKQVETFVGEKLIELGLINMNESENVRKYFPFSTSHFLGYDVHDAGDYDLPFQENTIITVEPGLCIPEEGIGIRLEDDVLIGSDGIKILTLELANSLQ